MTGDVTSTHVLDSPKPPRAAGTVDLSRRAAEAAGRAQSPKAVVEPKIRVAGLDFYYGARRVLEQVSLNMLPNRVTALIGPSGCGKSTFL
ncbi:MAG TPA: ATP-binding cassette domain-containing protein, partial [Vicinamibacterales bacterium]|nr:ATP-binding cassette domain-containing protein [Vicinamibacterales bacterium]